MDIVIFFIFFLVFVMKMRVLNVDIGYLNVNDVFYIYKNEC